MVNDHIRKFSLKIVIYCSTIQLKCIIDSMRTMRTSESTDANTNINTSSITQTKNKENDVSNSNSNSNSNSSDKSIGSPSNENNSRRIKSNSLNKSKLPRKATEVLQNWFLNNINHPYPNMKVKTTLSQLTGLTKKQIQNWYTNSRKVSINIFIINLSCKL